MGRTEPTFRHVLDREELAWRDYRRGLTLEEQRAFDALWQRARAHASASANVARAEPMESIVFSILLELELDVQRLRRRLERSTGA